MKEFYLIQDPYLNYLSEEGEWLGYHNAIEFDSVSLALAHATNEVEEFKAFTIVKFYRDESDY